jgi:integrase
MNIHIRFLKRNKNDIKGNLRLDCSIKGIRFRKYIDIRIDETNWNKNKERIKKGYTNAFEINKRLDFICNTIDKIHYELLNDDIPISVSALSEKFDEKINGVSRKTSFFDFAYEFVENSRNSKTKGTCDGYIHLINSLKEFEKQYRRRLDWSNFDYKFYTDYQTFQYNTNGNSQNLFGKRIAQIKAILNNATKLGLNKYSFFKEFKVLKTKSKKQYLNEEEIQLLLNFDLSDHKRLEKVRDIFLVCCYTGVRFSEYKNLKQENIELGKNGKSINYYSKKTKKYVHTICNEKTLDLLKKYQFDLPHISGQKYNEYIKEVCELAGIDNEILVHSYKAGKAISFKKKKYELIASHTARVSFVTNLHNNCISSSLIKTLTGHSNESMVNNYVHTTAKESIDLIHQALRNSG